MATGSSEKSVLLGVGIGRKPIDEIAGQALEAIEGKRPPLVFTCANPHSLVEAQADEAFFTALNDSDIVVADGVGVTMMAKLAAIDVGPRIAGWDFFAAVMQGLEQRGAGKVFFFGSSPRVLERMRERAARDYPAVEVDTLSPPFGEWSQAENDDMVARITAAQPDVLWVGMTAPKQEKWVAANRHRLAVPVVGSIGAVFDFFAGTQPRAPEWVCRLGLEWLYRFVREPRRMWRRNLVSAPKFALLVLRRHMLGNR